MPRSTWSLQDAKNKFSSVVNSASHGKPQTVTKHGKPVVVIVDASEFAKLQTLERMSAPSFADHLLALPTDNREFERLKGHLRKSAL